MAAWIVENTLVVALLCIAVAIVGPFLRSRPATRHALWLVVLIKLVTPPVVQWSELAPSATESVRTLYASRVRSIVAGVGQVTDPVVAAPALSDTPAAAGAIAAAPTAPARDPLPWTRVLGAIWLAGTMGLVGTFLRRMLAGTRVVLTRSAAPDWLTADLRELSRRLGIRPPRLVVVARLASPCTGGPFRTRILWPADLTDPEDRDVLRPILAHEIAHVRRRDVVTARFELLASMFWWWHPLFWFVRTRVREFAEQACDAWAMQLCPGATRRYADALVSLRADRRTPLGALPVRRGGVAGLRRRVRSIMRGAARADLSGASLSATAAMLLLVLPGWSCASATETATDEPATEAQNANLGAPLRPLPRAQGETWIADYSENQIRVVGENGGEIRKVSDMYGVWDAQPLANGHVLVVQFAMNRVVELDANDAVVFSFDDLKNPYHAERLPNGHTLIADTFGKRVVEVGADKKIVWQLPIDRPFDADRLANGNTLIADGQHDRVLEVDTGGKTVWQIDDVPSPHDADRLPNGHTLVTCRKVNEVREYDADGHVVSTISNLASPSGAERLDDGSTLVAESGVVERFDHDGKSIWKHDVGWATAVHRR